MFKNLIFFTFSLVLLVSCKEQIIIDNTLNESISVQIDEENFTIESNSYKELEINKGNHNVVSISRNGDTLLNAIINIDNEGVLNASNITYVLWSDIYCEEKDYNTYKTNLELQDTVTFDGLYFVEIDFKFYNEDFIPKTWDIGLNEIMPESVELTENSNYKILSKVFRPSEIKEEFNYIGDIDFNNLTEEEINSILQKRNQ